MYVDSLERLTHERRVELKARLRAHSALNRTHRPLPSMNERVLLEKYRRIQDQVLALLQEADACATEIRAERDERLRYGVVV